MAYTFTVVMLLSQLGLPLHMHYCKGMLESVSVFFSLGCDSHKAKQQVTATSACCKKDIVAACSTEKDDCCDDEIKLLTQEITSVSPQFFKWVAVQAVIYTSMLTDHSIDLTSNFSNAFLHLEMDTGPPIYLMHHALIFYG